MNILKTIRLTILFFAVPFTSSVFAQSDYFHCGTDQMVKQSLDNNPTLKKAFIEEQNLLEQQDKIDFENHYQPDNRSPLPPVYIIPVVFHILHVYGTENISDAQVKDEIRILNEDYRKLNSNFVNTVSSFTGIADDCEIEFRLAQKDPNGICTNGIDRIYSTLTNSGDDNAKLNYWTRSKYLNVWVVKTMANAGTAGYAYIPGTAPSASKDGIIILSNYIGSIGTGNATLSHALTHEVGHFLNLLHTWGSTNSPGVSCGNDGVTDTPTTEGHTTCALSDATCNSSIIENVQNFMEYSYCSTMFTTGQKSRMRTALTSATASRNSLPTTTNLAATGISTPLVLCATDFSTNTINNSVCEGDSITFTSSSYNANPTFWSWAFQGGTPSTSNDSVPTIKYNSTGTYSVSLTVTDGSGSVSATKTNYVYVGPSLAMYSNTFYAESFEGVAIPNGDWRVNNQLPGGNTWSQTPIAANSGTKSIMITNTAIESGNIDDLISPSIDIDSIAVSNPVMTFKVAYAQRTSTSVDKLQVYLSTNCGKTWILRKIITGTSLSTGGVQTNNFVPTNSQWALQTVSLSNNLTSSNLSFLFRFTSNGGNNIYLDDINIGTTTSIVGEQNLEANNFKVFPNPSDGNPTISFNLSNKQNVTLKIYDVVGRDVGTIFMGSLSQGNYHFDLESKLKLSSGIYFVQLFCNEKKHTTKLIVK